MKSNILFAALIFAGLWGASAIRHSPAFLQADTLARFVEFTKSKPKAFAAHVEAAVGTCADLRNAPAPVSERVRRISGTIVSKIFLMRAQGETGEGKKPQIAKWLRETVGNDLIDLSDEQFNDVVKRIVAVMDSEDTMACVITTAVAKFQTS